MGEEVWDEDKFGFAYVSWEPERIQPFREVRADQFHEWDHGVGGRICYL